MSLRVHLIGRTWPFVFASFAEDTTERRAKWLLERNQPTVVVQYALLISRALDTYLEETDQSTGDAESSKALDHTR